MKFLALLLIAIIFSLIGFVLLNSDRAEEGEDITCDGEISIAVDTFALSYRFTFCNDSLNCLTLDFTGDTLKVESDIPLSEGAEIFINWLKTNYDCEMFRLTNENGALKKEIEFLRNR